MKTIRLRQSLNANRIFCSAASGLRRNRKRAPQQRWLLSSTSSSSSISVTESMRQESLHQMELLQQFYRQQQEQQQQQQQESIFKLPLLITSMEQATQYRLEQQIQAVLLDCDGVVYRTLDVSPNAASCIASLLQPPHHSSSSAQSSSSPPSTKLLFVTNNASTNRSELRRKLENILFPASSLSTSTIALTDDMMIPTSYAAAQYLRQTLILQKLQQPPSSSSSDQDKATPNENHNDERNGLDPPQSDKEPLIVHVIGSSGLCQEIQEAGFQVTTVMDEDEPRHSMSRDELAEYPFDMVFPYHNNNIKNKNMAAMVIGLDTKFSYRKLCIANVLLQRHPQALCVATNMDTHDLVGKDGRHLPGNGSIVTCVAYASQRHFVDVGKPSVHLSKIVMSQLNTVGGGGGDDDQRQFVKLDGDKQDNGKHDITPSQCLMVGDRLDTDIAFAKRSGMKSALVLTGVATAQHVMDIIIQKQQQRQLTSSGITERDDELILPDVILPYLGLFA